RLREYGAYPLALHACRQVIRWRPQEPQSYRDQALALADAGRRQEALDSLRAMLARPYDRQIAQRFARGIEEAVVTEINQLAATAGLDTSGIDRRLLPRSMPVDIRVVLNWNMNNTDIDLHVTDPTGETCSYQHTATATGGRISRDITQGYGPEQFMIKKAVPGKYEVFVNYYGDSQVKISGPSTLLLEIYTRYADKQQKRELVCLQMDKEMKAGANGLVKVAEFEF
ncbi:MAG: DUF2135 domain-containing protein, partial [Odoribacteraceae bacterium]|nr:DUF2135 domain-containing protein [Odoribacteraceae bacterium]